MGSNSQNKRRNFDKNQCKKGFCRENTNEADHKKKYGPESTPDRGCPSQNNVRYPAIIYRNHDRGPLLFLRGVSPEAGTEAGWSPKGAFFPLARPARTPRTPASRPTKTPARLHPATHKRARTRGRAREKQQEAVAGGTESKGTGLLH